MGATGAVAAVAAARVARLRAAVVTVSVGPEAAAEATVVAADLGGLPCTICGSCCKAEPPRAC